MSVWVYWDMVYEAVNVAVTPEDRRSRAFQKERELSEAGGVQHSGRIAMRRLGIHDLNFAIP